MRMPNRTVYLPDDLDALSRRLGLNLSRITQDAVRRAAAERGSEAIDAQVREAVDRIAQLDITWPADHLAQSRAEAGER